MSSYDKRELEIIKKLKQGKSREDIAKDYNYSTWKNLDIFMRRRGYVWDGDNNIYELEKTNIDNIRDELISNISIKAEQIINRISDGGDPREIAKSLGFSDHREMAKFMTNEGLHWDSEIGNYVEVDSFNSNIIDDESNDINDEIDIDLDPNADIHMKNIEGNGIRINRYLPILELLYENKDRLTETLLDDNNAGNIPKYIIPGAAKTKSIYMNDKLARLMADFSSSNNISQREIVETSIILYLKKYGGSYGKDIDMLLSKK